MKFVADSADGSRWSSYEIGSMSGIDRNVDEGIITESEVQELLLSDRRHTDDLYAWLAWFPLWGLTPRRTLFLVVKIPSPFLLPQPTHHISKNGSLNTERPRGD